MFTPSKSTKARIEAEAKSFDWSKLDSLSDADIEHAAKSDPDTLLPTDAELAEAELVIPVIARAKNKQAAE